MMPDAIDDDTAVAVVNLWNSDKMLAGMTAFAPQRGRLKSQEPPYAALDVKVERREIAASGNPPVWFDFRRVELTVRGLEGDVRKIVGAARGDGVKTGVFVHGTELVLPSGAQCMALIPDKDATVEEETTNVGGKEIWKGTISFLVQSTRIG